MQLYRKKHFLIKFDKFVISKGEINDIMKIFKSPEGCGL